MLATRAREKPANWPRPTPMVRGGWGGVWVWGGGGGMGGRGWEGGEIRVASFP